ncbi:hypothetical protein QTP88_012364 [Uroleucon formosanum]
MPRERRANIGRRTRHASQQQVYSRNLREERQNIIRENDRLRHRVSTRRSLASYNRLAFQYDPTANYSDNENLDIGRMTTICRYCNALKFKRETVVLCCASGKVKLDPLLTPPQPLKTLFDGSDPDSSHFLQHILEYNNCFRMTSFGANIRANIGRRTRHASQQQVYSRNLREERQNIIKENDRLRHRVSTRRSLASYNRLAFQYDPTANYSDNENLDIGRMTTICRYCNALKFKRETVVLCCASGKVKLDPLLTPPQPLKTLFDGSDPDSSHFLQHILEYNNCFRMTSFGANIIREGGFMPTCKIQGQIYHLHGSMVPTPDEPHQFLQIYFISSMVDQLNVRCNIQGAQQLKRRIIEQLQAFFHANNAVVNMFKTALERMPSDTHKFVIRADCTPTGEHVRRFNAPTVNANQCLTIANKLLIEVGMIAPNRSMHDAFNQELNRELQYNVDTLQEFVRNNVPLLNEQQKQVYETLMQAVDNNTGGLFFLDAPGGTGKTFVISLILATIRSRCDIALALASSGIAATLLDGGRTAHSALKLPLNLNTIDTPTCNISRSSAMGKLLMQCKLIVWDECTMAHKKSLEALNFTLKDLRRNNNIFGGLMILLAGDFRQTLPVVPRGTPADELNACLKASPLWNNVKTLSLTTNMRVQLQNDQSAAQFSKQLLDLGNGKVPVDATSGLITLTNDFCRFVDTQLVLIENVFPNISENYKNYAWLSQRAILAAKNNDVHALNFTIQSKIAGDLVTYKSVDSITNPDDVVNYPTEFLNSLEIPGFPPHNLQLKVGTVIMILRNLNPPRLCNGTRLSVKRLMPNLIEATIINGKYAGENVCIPRIPMIPTDLPFDFKRLQFPVRLAFAMTINKSQGQSLSVCGINLENHCFSHGQLYVACSRVGKPSALFVLTSDQKTKNVVYQRALQ